jgi:hypothetical protein
MDDLELLSRMRADVPGVDPLALRRARRQLLARAVGGRLTAVRSRRRRSSVRLAVAAGLVAVLAGGVLATDTFTSNGRPVTGASADAATLLDRAATRASDPVVRPGQYRYVVTHAWYGNTVQVERDRFIFYLSEQRYELWVPYVESGTWYWRYTRPISTRFLNPADERWVREHTPEELVRHVELYTGTAGLITRDVSPGGGSQIVNGPDAPAAGWQNPTSQWLATLPREPGALLDRIHRDSRGQGSDPDSEALVFIGDVLRSGLVPADLRAGLFRAAGLIAGVRIVNSAVNLDGRYGIAVGRDDYQLIFDRDTYSFLGEQEVDSGGDPSVPDGTVLGSTAVTVRVADHPGFR